MSQPCAIVTCKRLSRALCHCCQQNLCITHLNEHNELLNSQLNPLTDEINVLGERLKTWNTKNVLRNCHQKLEQWRQDCHKKIDDFVEKKHQELDRLFAEKLNKQQEEITHIRSKLAALIREQEATHQDIDTLTSTIRRLEKQMNKLDETRFSVDTRPLLIDDTVVRVKEICAQKFNSAALSSVYKTIQ
jgi:chromosome segregation ATPase